VNDVHFLLRIKHKKHWLPINNWLFKDQVTIDSKYGYFNGYLSEESKEDYISYYSESTQEFHGHDSRYDKKYFYTTFSPVLDKFEAGEGFYENGNAKNRTRLEADVFKAVQAQCKVAKSSF
jgi:hypothetical protein